MADVIPAERVARGARIRFDAKPVRAGSSLILRLPDDASSALPSRGQVAVEATIDDHTFETVVEPDGRRGHWLKLDDAMQKALKPDSADSVAVELEPIKNWPEPDIPDDLRAALDAAPDLAETWLDITPMARWEWVRWISSTRNPETRSHRVEVAISKLRNGKRRPCCFDLSSCTDPELSKNGKLIDLQ